MKKAVSLLLALVLVWGLSVTALAGEATISTTVPQYHTVTMEADGGSVIANNKVCGETVLIERQKEQTYQIVPDKGKALDRLYYNGEDVTSQMVGDTFTAPPLIADATLKAVFKNTAVRPGGGGTVGGPTPDEDSGPLPGEPGETGGNTGTPDEDGNAATPAVPPGTGPVGIPGESGNPAVTPGTDHPDEEPPDYTDTPDTPDHLEPASAPVENGSATVTLEDGTRITVTGIPEDGLWLVVQPITDSALVAWFEKCVAPYGTDIYPMDIYFVNSQGVRIEITGTITVTVETLRNYSEPIVCYVAPDGAVTVMSSTVNGIEITFQTDHNSYYVLAEKLSDPTNTQPPDSPDETDEQPPQTEAAIHHWLRTAILLLLCCGLIIFLLLFIKKKKKQDAD